MTQKELSDILHGTGCPVNEGISSLKNEKNFPRIDYWEIAWEDVVASGEEYADKMEKAYEQVIFWRRNNL